MLVLVGRVVFIAIVVAVMAVRAVPPVTLGADRLVRLELVVNNDLCWAAC